MTNAIQLEEEERYEEAYEAYKKDFNRNPRSIDLLEKLGHLALLIEKKDEAEDYYLKLLELDNTRVVAFEQLIDIYYEVDKYKYHIYRGNLHILEGHMTYAVNSFKKAVENANEDKEIIPVRFVLADLYEKLNKPDNAIDEYLRLTDIDGVGEIAFIKLAQVYQKTNFLAGAIDTLELCRKKLPLEQRPNIDEQLALLYIRNSQSDLALKLTNDELTKARCLMDIGENDKAFEILENLKEKYKKEPKYYSLIAQYYYQKKLYDEALEYVNKFAELDSNSPLIYQMRAMIYQDKEDFFNEHLNWAKYNLLREDKDVALNEYMIAHTINESDAVLVDTIADFLYTNNDKTRSAEFYEKLLQLEPNNKKALQRLAEFRNDIGDTQGMIDYLETLKKIDPRNEFVKDNLDKAYKKIEMGQSPLDFFRNLFGGNNG